MLHSSGTTSRPNIVPLTQANIYVSAVSLRDSCRLTRDDRCLNVTPLFHVYDLVGGVLASLAAGASVVCGPGFLGPRFFEWLDAFRPTR